MANLTITNYDNAGITIGEETFEDGLLTHTGAGTIAAGTILGRVTSTGKWEKYDSGASTGEENPTAILTVASVATGAGDVAIRPMIKGVCRLEKVIDGNTSAAPTKAIQDKLRDYGIICVTVDELNGQDNQ